MPDLELLISRFDLVAAAPGYEREQGLAMLTVCEAMTANGSTPEEIREVLDALGLDPPA
jgi:hypothetical protein